MSETVSLPAESLTARPLRTHPLSFAVGAVQSLRQSLFPMVAAFFALRDHSWAILAALGVGLAIAAVSAGFAYIAWRRLTYTVGAEDIRVESGVLSRAARSVPFERIQDISLEQQLIPRLLGLVAVKFETGAGGADDLALTYLSEAEGERLRKVIKARRDGAPASAQEAAEPAGEPIEAAPEVLFAMGEKRLVTFGLFEFSLAIFAVIAGLFQYADTFVSINLMDSDRLSAWLTGTGGFLSGLGIVTQIVSLLTGLLVFALVGSLTGIVRTALRDWNFVLEKTDKGFRRRRGMFTRTDVVMPAHRVQAVNIGTGFIRRRFGWHGLKFVSLAQDSGGASHDVAPFAQLAEIAPIANAAGFAIEPQTGTEWQRGSRNYRIDGAVFDGGVMALIALAVAVSLSLTQAAPVALALIPLGLGIILAARQMFLWRHDFTAIDSTHFFVRRGWLAPRLDVASRVKLQSVEIARGPIARQRGYATLKLGLAGGTLEFEGLPVERAQQFRDAILASIARTDFSELNG